MEIKKLLLISAFLIVSFTLLLTPNLVLSYTPYTNYKDSTVLPSGYQRINPKTGEFQPIPYQGIIYTPDNPLYKWDNIKRLWNLWLDKHHIGFLRNSYNVTAILWGIILTSLSTLTVILFIRYLLFKKNLIKNEEEKLFLAIKAPNRLDKSAFATEQLFKFLHSHYHPTDQPIWRRFLIFLGFPVSKKTICLEIVSTKEEGIRYIIQVQKKDASSLEKTILSYIPGVHIEKLSKDSDYLPNNILSPNAPKTGKFISISEFNLSNHFSVPLEDLKVLNHYDPIAYITGHMTKLDKGEMVSMQVVLSPISGITHSSVLNTIDKLQGRIWNELEIEDIFHKKPFLSVRGILTFPFKILVILILGYFWVLAQFIHLIIHFFVKGMEPFFSWPFGKSKIKKVIKTPKQEQLYKSISSKIDGSLFEGSLRLFVVMNDKYKVDERVGGFTDSLSPFTNPSLQSLGIQKDFSEKLWNIFDKLTGKNLFYRFLFFKLKHRLLSFHSLSNPIFSVSETSDLYHLPYSDTTQTEDLVKAKTKSLAAPLAFKTGGNHLDITYAINSHGGEDTLIGLTKEQRRKHMYIIGATGVGKTTLLSTMIYQDIKNNKGLCVIDPHGQLINNLLPAIPKNRIKDIIWFSPDDDEFPIGLNILELLVNKDISQSALDKQKSFIASSINAIFHKLYDDKYFGPRMEYVLRNAILAILETENPTLVILQDFLTKDYFRDEIVKNVKNKVVRDYWLYEFSKLSVIQQNEVVSPITNKIGAFLSSPMTYNIFSQYKSKLSFDDLINKGKIILCDLSKGNIGADQASFFGNLIISKIYLATLRRTNIPEEKRKDFYLYVDEFQNFATSSFADILSEARKYRLNAILAHQSTAQIEDIKLIKVILANVGTVICFRTANPEDENFILPIFTPEVDKHEITNLPLYTFYTKIMADEPQEAFVAKVINFTIKGSEKIKQTVIKSSRKLYATPVEKLEKEDETYNKNLTNKRVKRIK